jgi:hypothetical protein
VTSMKATSTKGTSRLKEDQKILFGSQNAILLHALMMALIA